LGLFVTGTDTGVGKTAVSAGILAVLREEGLDVAPMKPIETGHRGEGWPADARCLHAASGLPLRQEHVVPYALRDPLAPQAAARRQGIRIDWAKLDDAYRELARTRPVLVEGAGGLAVPVDAHNDMADLALRWRLPVLIVARPQLGTINHTRLTLEYARQRGLEVLGVVINAYPEDPGLAEESNPKAIADWTGLPVLGILRRRDDVDVENAAWTGMAEEVRKRMDLGPIRRALEAKA
jgi:dethiobiotin synthetase